MRPFVVRTLHTARPALDSPAILGAAGAEYQRTVPHRKAAAAHQALDANGEIADAALRGRFEQNVAAFMSLAEAAKNYPCIKRAWIEFLGEHPDAATERVQ